MGRLSKSTAAVGVAALMIVGGGAYALASSGGGAITVCVNHKSGVLYKARKCARNDKKLTWNRQGPTGATGATGLQGLQGQPGPSRGNFATCGDTTSSTADGSGGGQTQVRDCTTTVTAPSAGKLLANGSAQVTTQYNPCPGGMVNQISDLIIDGASVNFGQQPNVGGFATRLFPLSGGANVAAGSHTVTFEITGSSSGVCTAGFHLNMQSAASVQVIFVKGPS